MAGLGIDDADFEPRQRPAESRDALRFGLVPGAGANGACCFGHAEAADLQRLRHRGHDRLGDARRLHREVAVHQLDARQVRRRRSVGW